MSVAAIAFMAPHGRFRNLSVTDGGTIISDNAQFDTDGLGNATATSVTTNTVTANADNVFGGTFQLGIQGGSPTALATGGNIPFPDNVTSIARFSLVANVTAVSMPFPTQITDGQLAILINTSGSFTATFDIQANSGMADGTSCVIPNHRALFCIWDPTELGGTYYHT